METKRLIPLTLFVLAIGAVTFSGCSSSEVQDESAALPAEDLPVVDANTDALPNSLESSPGGADQLQPEAVVDVPDGQDHESAALTEQVASTDQQPPAENPAGPSMDAPPSMNEVAAAPPVASVSEGSGGGSSTYEVQSGDTLMKVAYKVYGDIYQWKKILEENHDRISDPAHLVAGTQLRTENPAQEEDYSGFEKYLIKGGDTLGTISNDVYGTKAKWKRLWKENDRLIKDPNRIYAGFFLKYSFTEEDRSEKGRVRDLKQDPQPLAHDQAPAEREPTSANGPTTEPVNQN